MNKIQELYDKKIKLVEDQRAILGKAEEEKRDITPEEEKTYETMGKDYDKTVEGIRVMEEDEEKRTKRKADLEAREADLKATKKSTIKPDPNVKTETRTDGLPSLDYLQPEYRTIFKEHRRLTNGRFATLEYDRAWNRAMIDGLMSLNYDEQRALQADLDTKGGFLVTPEQFIAKLIMKMDNLVFMRQKATIIRVPSAESLGVAALDADPIDPTWKGEISEADEDNTMAFDKRNLFPHPLKELLKVSEKLLRVAVLPIDTLVKDRLAYKFSVVEENTFLNGSGSNQPLGLFTDSGMGISSASTYNVSAGNTSSAVRADGLINAKYNLKAQYQARAEWIFHRDVIKQIRKLKTGEGEYLWRAGIATDRPDTILDRPFHMSEYAPNTFSASKYVGIIGDFTFYWIVDALDIRIQVIMEKYITTGQIGYLAQKETDGMPVLAEAFTRVKLGS